MKGHIRRRGRGSWAVVIDIGRNAAGRRQQRWHKVRGTRKDAERELSRLVHSLHTGEYVEPSKLTVSVYLDRWLADSAKPNTSRRTYSRYEGIIRCNIKPVLGHCKLAALHPLVIQQLYASALDSGRRSGKGGLSPRTVLHIHRVLHTALRQAVRWQLLARNPADAVTPPRAVRTEMRVFDELQSGQLLRSAETTDFYVPVLLALTTGMRRGEILSLTWDDVDLPQSKVTVTKTLEQTNDGLFVKPPKTARSRRSIPLPALTVDALRKHKRRQAAERLRLGSAFTDQGLVCPTRDGEYWKPDTFSKAFHVFMASQALPVLRFHDLRHTHATQLLKQSTHPKIVAERLGHSTITLTLDTYSHVVPGMQEDAARAIDRALRKAIKETGS